MREQSDLHCMFTQVINELIKSNNDVSNHHRNIQTLLIEVLNMKSEFAPPITELMLNW